MSETVSWELFGTDRTRHPTLGMKTDFALQHWIADVTRGWSSTVGQSQFNRNQMVFLWIKILIEFVYVAQVLWCVCACECVFYTCGYPALFVAGMYPWSQSSHWANCSVARPAPETRRRYWAGVFQEPCVCDTREVGESHSLTLQSGEDFRLCERTHYTFLKTVMDGSQISLQYAVL